MNTSETDLVPLHKLQKNKWYQLAKPIVIPFTRSWNSDISEAVASLYKEPHQLSAIYGSKGRGGILTEITVQFEKTPADKEERSLGVFENPIWHINSRQFLPEGWNTLFIDIEAREKLYAPPSENGSNKGGLFYRLGKKRFETLAANPNLAPPYNREGLNTKYQRNPNAFKNFLKNNSSSLPSSNTTTTTSSSSSSVGGKRKRKQRATRKSRKSLYKNKRKHTHKHRLWHLERFF